MTDDELEARQQELSDDIRAGAYPSHECVRELCELVAEWTSRKRQTQKLKPEWEERDESAKKILQVLSQANEQIIGENFEAALHCAFAAGSIFTEAGLSKITKTGSKVLQGASDGGQSSAKWPERTEELQTTINQIHKEKPDRSYEEMKRLANKRHGYPLSALKRYTTNPQKS